MTQALSPESIVQSNITYSTGHGYYSDPYKTLDIRPEHRRIFAWLTRYREHIPWTDATLKLSYRYLRDSFGSEAHAVVFTSVTTAYLLEERYQELLVALARAGNERPLAWLALEGPRGEPDYGGLALDLTTWPGGDERKVADTGAHGRPVRWLA